VLSHLDGLLREAPAGQSGALWRLAQEGRQLDANVIRLLPDAQVTEHVEPDVDVLLHVLGGSGQLETDSGRQELVPGCTAWLPHGARRSLRAGADGLLYLTVHRRRSGLTIRSASAQREVEPEGGESACLLNRVCVECGRLASEAGARFCGQCGERLPTDAQH
jgi:quercetin dioxygenase-like cupin family protein